MIRYHSLYPWHVGGAYRQFMVEDDYNIMEWVIKFNKFDLYTKDDNGLDSHIDDLWLYYQTLIDKYFPSSELIW